MTPLRTLSVTEDGFAFDSATGESYTLNRFGQLVLRRLQQGETRPQIVDFLSDEFGIARSSADRDIADFMQQLQTLGLTGATR